MCPWAWRSAGRTGSPSKLPGSQSRRAPPTSCAAAACLHPWSAAALQSCGERHTAQCWPWFSQLSWSCSTRSPAQWRVHEAPVQEESLVVVAQLTLRALVLLPAQHGCCQAASLDSLPDKCCLTQLHSLAWLQAWLGGYAACCWVVTLQLQLHSCTAAPCAKGRLPRPSWSKPPHTTNQQQMVKQMVNLTIQG